MTPPTPPELVEQIDVRLLANLSQNFRSPFEAVFELVDNGLASRLPGNPVAVTVTGSGRAGDTLKVITKGGGGMGTTGLQEFLHWGKEPATVGLNRFGQGGKAAIGYLGKGLRITANRYDEDTAYQIEDHDWLARPNGELKRFRPRTVRAPVPDAGVVQIEILNLRKAVNFKRLERELAWRYRPALRDGVLELCVGGTPIEPVELVAEQRREFSHPLIVPSLDDPTKTVPVMLSGWVGVAPPKFEDRGGIRCSAYGRVVIPHEYFGHRTASFKASLNSLIGEVDLSFVPLVLDKNEFDKGSDAWEAAELIVHAEMQPFVDQLLRRREVNEPSDEERLRAMEARDIAHRALEKIAAESERAGLAGQLHGRKRPEPRPERGVEQVLRKELEVRVKPEPRTPPPPDAVGRLRRKGLTLDWDVRALDPKTRSATVEENGRTEIVINSQFPAYRQRSGDLLYMLETGLEEELKPSGDQEDKTVEEYHRQVADALYVALSDAGALGRSRRAS